MDVTIIIPTYNRMGFLPKAIASCKSEGVEVQVIVVDDGSTDGTWDMLQQMEGIGIFRQQHWGKPWAVNMAFQHARGEYIKFLDSDDWLAEGILAKQFALAEKENADIVVAGYYVYEDEHLVRTQPWTHCDDFIAQNLGECDSSHYSAFLFRKDFVRDIPHRTSFASANFASRDDRCFMLEASLKEPKVSVLEEPALCHRHHTKGRLQFQHSLAAACTNYQHLLIYKNIIGQLAATNRLTERRIKAATSILWPLAHWIAKDSLPDAVKVVDWIYELDPNFKVPEKGALSRLYKTIGFKPVEKLLRFRRLFTNAS
ncbi:MAG: glycosyltransferase family 2 protein [Bacteroidetes bacterium]|nr:glycosyltransferase family 2 protein [Bacteroidota bacterium]